jgi:GTP cyclohydrolase I
MCMQMRGIEKQILLPLPLLYRSIWKKKTRKEFISLISINWVKFNQI